MRVLTTLLDYTAYPAREIAVLYAERWQIEIAFLPSEADFTQLSRCPLRGQSPELARQEAQALLLIHNITATGRVTATSPRSPAGPLRRVRKTQPGKGPRRRLAPPRKGQCLVASSNT